MVAAGGAKLAPMNPWTEKFLKLAREAGALTFGEFRLKSGRISPYFFNAGAFCDGRLIDMVADCYADAIVDAGVEFDLMFGPAYKGIPLAATVAASLHRRHARSVPVAYNRKEAKDHGEGGTLVGAPVAGRVLVVDDVISAGTAFDQARELVGRAGGRIVALAVGLDRQERAAAASSAGAQLRAEGIDVIAVATLDDLVHALRVGASNSAARSAMLEYRSKYGVSDCAEDQA